MQNANIGREIDRFDPSRKHWNYRNPTSSLVNEKRSKLEFMGRHHDTKSMMFDEVTYTYLERDRN